MKSIKILRIRPGLGKPFGANAHISRPLFKRPVAKPSALAVSYVPVVATCTNRIISLSNGAAAAVAADKSLIFHCQAARGYTHER